MQLILLGTIIATTALSNGIEKPFNHDVNTIVYEDIRNKENKQINSFVNFSQPKDLNPNESFSWMHNNAKAEALEYGDVPTAHGVLARFYRLWKVKEVGDIGSSNITFNLAEYGIVDAASLKLLIDTDKDGLFSDEQPGVGILSGAKSTGNDHYTFENVNIADGQVFTLATIELKSTTLKFDPFQLQIKFENEIASIEWKTKTEINCNHYEIEKSGDGKYWELLSIKNGSGNSKEPKVYTEIDYEPYYGNTYYRLKQIDHDNNFTYSKNTSILNVKRKKKVSLHQESSNTVMKVVLEGSQIIKLELLDGQKSMVNANTSVYWNVAEIDLEGLTPGTYDVIVTTKENEKILRKLIKM